jgi:tetratricopeptide (TPR) repeat protein
VPAPVSSERAASLAAEGVSLARAGNLAEGREKLQQAADSGGADAVAYYNLAVTELMLGDRSGAEIHGQKAVELSRGSQKAVDFLVNVMLARQRPDLLASYLEDQADRLPDSIPVRVGLARARIAQGRAAEALRDASELLRKDEANADIMKAIARAYLAMGRTEAAQFVLSQSLEIRKDAEAYDLLGQMALKAGETARATSMFQQAIALNANLADAHNNLGVIYQAAGDLDNAIVEFQAALKVDPGYAVALMNLGNAFRKAMRFADATDAYQRALRADPSCADCYFNLGVAELENKGTGKDEPGHYRRAIEYFGQYRQLRGMRRDDDADKYADEARRMAEILEKDQAQMKEPPPPEPPPAPDGG